MIKTYAEFGLSLAIVPSRASELGRDGARLAIDAGYATSTPAGLTIVRP